MKHKELIDSANEAARFLTCQLSFPSLLLLRKYDNQIAFDDDFVYIRQGYFDTPDAIAFMLPIPRTRESFARFSTGMSKLREYAEERDKSLLLCDIADDNKAITDELFGDAVEYTELPENFDYVYLRSGLINLDGGSNKHKRRKINAFLTRWGDCHRYDEITEADIPAVKRFQEKWMCLYGAEKAEGIERENAFIARCLDNWSALSLIGATVRVNGEISAYTFGAKINSLVFDTLIEKADYRTYPELYKVINYEFALNTLKSFSYINRENDAGIEGLRYVKETYHPDNLLKKYITQTK